MLQEGSIVVMDKPMEEALWQAMAKLVGVDPPRPSEETFIVSALSEEEKAKELHYKEGGIYLDEYPKYYQKEVPFDASLFKELLPPEPEIQKLTEKDKKPIKRKVLEPEYV